MKSVVRGDTDLFKATIVQEGTKMAVEGNNLKNTRNQRATYHAYFSVTVREQTKPIRLVRIGRKFWAKIYCPKCFVRSLVTVIAGL